MITSLDVQETPVSDLSPLKELRSLERLNIAGSNVTDLRPLAGLRLTRLIFTPSRITAGLDVVRNMNTLTQLDTAFEPDVRPAWSPEEFWRRFDAGELSAETQSR